MQENGLIYVRLQQIERQGFIVNYPTIQHHRRDHLRGRRLQQRPGRRLIPALLPGDAARQEPDPGTGSADRPSQPAGARQSGLPLGPCLIYDGIVNFTEPPDSHLYRTPDPLLS